MSQERPHRVLVAGGAGVFGGRLVAGILAMTAWEVVVIGRDPTRLAAFAEQAHANGRLSVITADISAITVERLRDIGANAVVDAAGPFQGSDFRLARTAIAAGIHYVDLSDARDATASIDVLHDAARKAGVAALSGASTTPALTNAVLDVVTNGWLSVDTVMITIAPGNRAPRGLSVMRSILGYAGRPVRVFMGGAWREKAGWGMTRLVSIPGLRTRFASLVETPDLDIVPARLHVRDTVLFFAALELSLLQLGLLITSLPVRAGVLRSLLPFAGLFHRVAAWFEPLGTDRGGMVVEALGVGRDGQDVRARWWLVAEAGDGPFVPTLPALAVLRALADGSCDFRGASACVGVVGLDRILDETRRLRITTGSVVTNGAEPT